MSSSLLQRIFGSNSPTPAATTAQPGQATPPAPVQPAPPTPGNIPQPVVTTAVTPGTEPNGVVPEGSPTDVAPNQADVAKPEGTDSPLDKFQSLWDTAPNKDGEKTNEPVALDPVKLQEIISKADFSKNIPAETLNTIAAGGDGAQKAFAEAMNSVAQQTLMQATIATDQMIKQAVSAAVAKQNDNLPAILKQQRTKDNLHAADPLFSNPAVAPIIDAVSSQLLAKHPNASATEISVMAQDFVKALGASLNPATVDTVEGEASVQDWADYMKG